MICNIRIYVIAAAAGEGDVNLWDTFNFLLFLFFFVPFPTVSASNLNLIPNFDGNYSILQVGSSGFGFVEFSFCETVQLK